MYKLTKAYRKFTHLYTYMHMEENEYTATCTYEYANPWVSRRYCTVVYVLTMIALANVKM